MKPELEEERWQAIPGYRGYYEASDQGRIRSLPRVVINSRGATRRHPGVILKPAPSPNGYPQVRLSVNGACTSRTVHALVLEAFIGPRPPGMVACHRDDEKTNNRLDNLRWDTLSANALDRVRNGHDAQASKTHCKRGHPFDEENTYIHPRGRDCQTCRRMRSKKSRERAIGVAQ